MAFESSRQGDHGESAGRAGEPAPMPVRELQAVLVQALGPPALRWKLSGPEAKSSGGSVCLGHSSSEGITQDKNVELKQQPCP